MRWTIGSLIITVWPLGSSQGCPVLFDRKMFSAFGKVNIKMLQPWVHSTLAVLKYNFTLLCFAVKPISFYFVLDSHTQKKIGGNIVCWIIKTNGNFIRINDNLTDFSFLFVLKSSFGKSAATALFTNKFELVLKILVIQFRKKVFTKNDFQVVSFSFFSEEVTYSKNLTDI